MRFVKMIMGLIVAHLSITAAYADAQHGKPAPVSANYEQLKQLLGEWQGKVKIGNEEEEVNVSYQLSSGGHTIVEKLFVGKPHEMISIYYPKGKDVYMTHYCAEGNRPELKLQSANAKQIKFEMNGLSGIDSKDEMHMHALNLTMNGPNQLTQEWISHDKGKQTDVTVITLARKK